MSIRTGKILLAMMLFISGARESLMMWRQTGEAVMAIGFFVTLLVCCGLLLWSASRPLDPLRPPRRGWRVFWTVISVVSALSILGSFTEMLKPRQYRHVVEVNGLKIPVDDCVDGSVRMMKKKEERISFCTCMATKLAGDSAVVKAYRYELERGRMDGIIPKLQEAGTFDMSQLSACMADSPSASWTEDMIAGARRTCLAGMRANGSDADYDVEVYCDCLVSKLSQHPPSVVATGQDDPTSVVSRIQEECSALSEK